MSNNKNEFEKWLYMYDDAGNKTINVKSVVIIILALLLVILSTVFIHTRSQLINTENEYISVSDELVQASSDLSVKNSQNTKYKIEIGNHEATIESISQEFGIYQRKMEPYEELEEAKAEEQRASLDEKRAERESIEDEKRAESESIEQAEKESAAESESLAQSQGYETGITYEQLARTPDDYVGEKIKFYGKIIQVIEGDRYSQYRLAVNDDYDTIILAEVPGDLIENNRILEDDYVTFNGTYMGLISYESTLGGTITIPGMYVEVVE